MNRSIIYGLLAFAVFGLLVGCNGLSLDTYWRSERYVLIAVDAKGQMGLAVDQGNGTALGLVGATVFSIGADSKFIVLKQHPATDAFGHFDRSITNYFVVARTTSNDFADRKKGVTGPLNKADFDKMSGSLSLPGFSTTFSDLE